MEPLGKVIVDGATFTIAIDLPAVLTSGSFIHTLIVNSSANLRGKDGTKSASLKSDMEGQAPVAGLGYNNPPYMGGILSWDGVLSGSQESTKCTKDTNGATVDDTNSGTVEFTIVTPAIDPGPPAPDPKGVGGKYPGTWTLISANNTKLTTNE